MKIEKIILHNIASIEGEQTIDFTTNPLDSAGLFAITGRAGTGKSTLLDALCLALYGRAPHYGLSSDEASVSVGENEQSETGVCNIMRYGQRSCGVKLLFASVSGERYEAEWSMQRTRGGIYKPAEHSLRQISPDKHRVPVEDIPTYIEAVLGLTYEQFIRTVFLAHDRFAQFLNAQESDKPLLLEQLIGTEHYAAISKQIARMTLEAQAKVAALESRMQGLLHDRLESAALKEEQDRCNLLKASKETIERSIDVLNRQLAWITHFEVAKQQVLHCESELMSASKACAEMRADELKLERYDALLVMQPLYQEIKLRSYDIENIKVEENSCALQIEQVSKLLGSMTEQLNSSHVQVVDAERRLALRSDAISRGHALSGEINVADDQLKHFDNQLIIAGRTFENRQNVLRAKQERLAKVASEMEGKQQHKQSLSVHRLMFEKFDLIKDKLSMLNTETQRNVESHRKQQMLQKRKTELKIQGERAEQQQHDNQAKLNALKSELLIHRQTNKGRDSAKLQKKAAENRSTLTALRRAATLWQHISSGYVRIAEKVAIRKREETELKQKQLLLAKIEVELKSTEEAYNRISTAYTLSQSDNILKLRKQLKEGTACPVCGGTHHPYHTETERELGELLVNLNKEFMDMQEQLNQKRSVQATLREEIAADQARIVAYGSSLEELQKRQDADIKEWSYLAYLDNSFADCSPTVNREARAMMIQLLIDNITRSADEADHELETFNFHQQHINRLNEEISVLDVAMADNHTYLDKVSTEVQIVAAAAEDLLSVINLSDKACSELYTDLDEMITLSGWFTEWKNNPDGLRMRLTDLHQDWTQTCTSLDELQRSADLLGEEMKSLQANVDEAQRAVVLCRENRDAMREKLSGKQEEMRRLLGENTPKRETEILHQAVQQARNKEDELRKVAQQQQDLLRALEGKRDNLCRSREYSQKIQAEKQQQLDLLILRFNGSNSPVQFVELERVFADTCNWKSLRTRLEQLKERRIAAENNLEQVRNELLKLKASAERPEQEDKVSKEALLAQLEELSVKHAALVDQLAFSASRILSHEHSLEHAAKLQEQLDEAITDYTEWQNLNNLLGSADGSQFRMLAQNELFDRIIAHSNYHLQTLEPRFSINRVPATLSLEVIDRQLLGQHRHPASLSQGEQKVICLALAFGLASFIKGNVLNGSLFVDEGTERLDSESASYVIQALSRMIKIPGRKVGFIARSPHAECLISPQVRLVSRVGGNGSVIQIG